ncbi:unnamed protein product [Somion occarium]|uniref:2,6-dihydroxypyridine 3-monooxygenase substrate binding domain-containing protein n=1 Tax=Somion occarium TaxID=3059160 RepID=A0ABP1D567_9APHY
MLGTTIWLLSLSALLTAFLTGLPNVQFPTYLNFWSKSTQRLTTTCPQPLTSIDHNCPQLNFADLPDDLKMMRIVVVGGSIGGLMAGVALKRLGHRITILERSPTQLLHDQGAGIVVGGENYVFMLKHDLTRTPWWVDSPYRHYLDRAGNVISRSDYPQRMTSWDALYHILRANFDGMKSANVPNPPKEEHWGEYRHGCGVTRLETSPDPSNKVITAHYVNPDGTPDTIEADMVIVSDGSGGSLHYQLCGKESQRTYAGYVAWRGTVLESKLSPATQEALVEKFTFHHSPALQILSYLVPGENGSVERGNRKLNWVWYNNIPHDSEHWKETMTDTEGNLHQYILRAPKIRPEVLEKQLQKARDVLPPSFCEAVEKTDYPFIQAITDSISSRAVFLEGRVVLLGDAVAGFRPHTAASTSQAAMHALFLEEFLSQYEDGQKGLSEKDAKLYELNALAYAKDMSRHGIEMGNLSQFGNHPLARASAGRSR